MSDTLVTRKNAYALFWANGESVTVGTLGVTEIVRVPRNGLYCDIPYFEVWKGDTLYSEHAQHALESVVWEKIGT